MKIILVRHGETEENRQKIVQGQLHGTLSESGKEQAKKLANRLKDEKIDVIISSDLNRAKHTAEEIAKFHPEAKIEIKEELRERNWGEFEGKRKDDIEYWKEIESKETWSEDLIEKYGGETPQETKERIIKFNDELLKNFRGKIILIVTHGTIGGYLLNHLMRGDSKEKLKNTSVTIFEFNENGKPELKLFNCAKHLEE